MIAVIFAVASYRQAGSANKTAQEALSLQRQGIAADIASDAAQVSLDISSGKSIENILVVRNGSRTPLLNVSFVLYSISASVTDGPIKVDTATSIDGCRTAAYELEIGHHVALDAAEVAWQDLTGSKWHKLNTSVPAELGTSWVRDEHFIASTTAKVVNTEVYTGGKCK